MKLLTKAIEKALKPLDDDKEYSRAKAVAHFFTAWINFDWYPVAGRHEGKGDNADFVFYGFVRGFEDEEWGFFSLRDLESIKGPGCLKVERELRFPPTPISKIINKKT